MPTPPRIRRAELEDFEAILDLWEELMRLHAELDPVFTPAPDGRDYYRLWLSQCHLKDEAILLVAELSGEVVGYALGYLQHMPPSMRALSSGMVSDVCIARDWRDKGIGRRLFAAMENEFRRLGVTRLEVKTSSLNAQSNHFWQKVCGFQEFVRMHSKTLAPLTPPPSDTDDGTP